MHGRIAFLVPDDSTLMASGLPLVGAARELGLEADVVTPAGMWRAEIESAGARPIGLGSDFGSLNPMRAGFAAGQLAALFKRTKPDLVHCLGLGPVLIGGAACTMAGIDRRIYAIGFIGPRMGGPGFAARAARRAVTVLLKGPLRSAGTRYAFWDAGEARLFGFDPERATDVVVMQPDGVTPETALGVYRSMLADA